TIQQQHSMEPWKGSCSKNTCRYLWWITNNGLNTVGQVFQNFQKLNSCCTMLSCQLALCIKMRFADLTRTTMRKLSNKWVVIPSILKFGGKSKIKLMNSKYRGCPSQAASFC